MGKSILCIPLKTYSEQHGGEGRVFLGVNHGEKLWQVPLSSSNKKQSEKFNSYHLLCAFVKDLNKSKCQESNKEVLTLVIINTLAFMLFIIKMTLYSLYIPPRGEQ